MAMQVLEAPHIIVVGSGVAGLAATVEAAKAGARVTVVESEQAIGGASAISGGGCCIVDTPAQRALGIVDSVDLALQDWIDVSEGRANVEAAKRYLTESMGTVWTYLVDLGMEWQAGVRKYPDNSVPRWHRPEGGGGAVVAALYRAASAYEVEWRMGERLTEIRLVNCSPRLTLRGVDGVESILDGDAVVFATGGFSNNPQMIDVLGEKPPTARPPLCGGGPDSHGDGHRILEAIGALMINMDNLWLYPVGVPNYRYPGTRRGLVIRGITDDLWFSADGERFHDETDRGGRAGAMALSKQPGGYCWAIQSPEIVRGCLIFDDGYFGTTEHTISSRREEFLTHSASVVYASTLEELALITNLPEKPVRAELDRIRDLIDSGFTKDPDTGRALEGLDWLDGPYVAVRYELIVQKTFGGVKTDADGRVLNRDLAPVPRVYACGELAGMAEGNINGSGAIEGTMFGPCLWSGQNAGRAAATQLLDPVPNRRVKHKP